MQITRDEAVKTYGQTWSVYASSFNRTDDVGNPTPYYIREKLGSDDYKTLEEAKEAAYQEASRSGYYLREKSFYTIALEKCRKGLVPRLKRFFGHVSAAERHTMEKLAFIERIHSRDWVPAVECLPDVITIAPGLETGTRLWIVKTSYLTEGISIKEDVVENSYLDPSWSGSYSRRITLKSGSYIRIPAELDSLPDTLPWSIAGETLFHDEAKARKFASDAAGKVIRQAMPFLERPLPEFHA